MRQGIEAAMPRGGADSEAVGRSFAHAAEELVRAGAGASIQWDGATLTTHFQPIYCVRSGFCLGFEALVRAADRDGTAIRAEELFARTREGSRTLLDWVCRALHLRNYATVDPGDRTLFVNVHPEAAVRDARHGRELSELIRYYGLVPQRVCIEILEAPCSDEGLLREAVDGYRDLGASIAMDDFGIGRSNFDRVTALRPDVVKIDRSILAQAVGDATARRMLPGMIELLHASRARVAVEGIESEREALTAIAAKADYLQGFYFGVPKARLGGEMAGMATLDELLHPASVRHAAA